jgi:DNA invertase Pin-like site-specific DNA recombinase
MPQNKKEKKVAIYHRIRTLERSNNPNPEIDRCKDYINKQDSMTFFKLYNDCGESAVNWNRPKLQEMLSDIRKGKIDAVVTISLDKISRSAKDFYRILEILDVEDVSLISITQAFDTGSIASIQTTEICQ